MSIIVAFIIGGACVASFSLGYRQGRMDQSDKEHD